MASAGTDGGPDAPRLRAARPEDAVRIAEIYNESVAVGDATMEETPWTAESVSSMMERFSDREGVFMLVDAVGDTLGWGVIKRYSDREGYRFACETAVYLPRESVGRGLGSRIKAGLIDQCRVWGYHHLVAKIFAKNQASIEYNRKFGYELVGVQRQIGYKNGQWQDVAILQLVLDDDAPEAGAPGCP
ncbi:MAG: N-acetyltransferase family protein [Acidobacteriota bacterium]